MAPAKAVLAEAAVREREILPPEDVIVAAHPDDRTHVATRPIPAVPLATMERHVGPATVGRSGPPSRRVDTGARQP